MARAVPPIRTKPANAGCSLRNLQMRSVSGGSTSEPLLDVGQDTFHGAAGTRRGDRGVAQQLGPLLAEAFQSKLQRDAQQTFKTRPQQRRPNAHGIIRLGIGPDQSRMLLPKL